MKPRSAEGTQPGEALPAIRPGREEVVMKIGVFGTGMVGTAIATKLVELGHEVILGSRTEGNEKGVAWAAAQGPRASAGSFAQAAERGELLFNCTQGAVSLDVLAAAGAERMGTKVLVDLANPLDFSKGLPPTLLVCNSDSLGERLQNAFPDVRIVKTLNTVNASVMVDPGRLPERHTMLLCGNDADAKATVRDVLESWFGWQDVLDLGDITAARGMEMMLPVWVRLWSVLKSPDFNFKIVR